MARVIFTADDYGVIPGINKAIIKAVKRKKINSVAAFSNHPSAIDNVKRLQDESGDSNLEIGCHLTLTSGKPVSDRLDLLFTNKSGFFRKFNNMKKIPKSKKDQIKGELKAQIDRFIDNDIEVKHLSSHHNALFFFKHYTKALFEVAVEYGIPVRSPISKPDRTQNLFIIQLFLRLIGNMSKKDRLELSGFMRSVPDFLNKLNPDQKPKFPAYIDTRHYGPVPILKLESPAIIKEAAKKRKEMKKTLKKIAGQDRAVEFVFHVIHNDYLLLDSFQREASTKNSKYSGINPAYFDCRMAEYTSLMGLKLPKGVHFGSWNELD